MSSMSPEMARTRRVANAVGEIRDHQQKIFDQLIDSLVSIFINTNKDIEISQELKIKMIYLAKQRIYEQNARDDDGKINQIVNQVFFQVVDDQVDQSQ